MTMTPVAVISGFAPDNNYAVPIVRDKCIYILHEIPRHKKSMNQNRGVRIDVVGYDEKKDNYFAVIEEIWELDYVSLIISLFRCQRLNRAGGGVAVDWYGMTIVDFKKIGYTDEPPFILAKDVTHVFYVKDMSSKPKQNPLKSTDEPKCHIVLPEKEKSLELRIFRTSQKT